MSSSLIIVVPCYNEADRIESGEFISYISSSQETTFIFVNDGSSDDTEITLQKISNQCPEKIKVISLEDNRGKAEAVRSGINDALKHDVSHVGFWDADLATPLSEIERFKNVLVDNKQYKIVCGARIQRLGAQIERHWYRHYPGRIIATIISCILQLPVYDTQCGAKVFSKDLAEEIFNQSFLSPWLFDVELIARTIGILGKQQAAKCIYELPLKNWRDVGSSKIGLNYFPRIPLELMRIYFHYRQQIRKV